MKKSPAVAGYIYAIQSPENRRHVKLGLSSNPRARLRQLQTGNPYKLDLVWDFPVANMAAAENVIHATFDKYRIPGGEWFDFHPINDPQALGAWLTMVACKNFVQDLPPKLHDRLTNLDALIASPAKFLDSQRASEEMLTRQFPDVDKYAHDPAALEEYIWLNVVKDGRR